jgi:lysophospholipase L1-like esterase
MTKRTFARSFDVGARLADGIIDELDRRGVAPAAGSAGLLVTEGDSWFDYSPFETVPRVDIVDDLRELHGWRVENVAHKGDNLENMAYDDEQLRALVKTLKRLRDHGEQPDALLLSGGGNDLAGPEFAILLEHAASERGDVNPVILDEVVDQRLRAALTAWIGAATRACEKFYGRRVPIVVHGYAHAVPDGRGYLGGGGPLPGPWLAPAFDRKRYHEDLPARTKLMATVIDKFNVMVETACAAPSLRHVSYVDLRPVLRSGRNYRRFWANELHPTSRGFELVSDAINKTLRAATRAPRAG